MHLPVVVLTLALCFVTHSLGDTTLAYTLIGTVNGRSFFTSDAHKVVDWETAMDFCNQNLLKPAAIFSNIENNLLQNYLNQYAGGKNFWIPAVDFGRLNDYYWVQNGYPLSYSNWHPNAFDDTQADAYYNCAEMLPNGYWYRQVCNQGNDNGGYNPVRNDLPLCESLDS